MKRIECMTELELFAVMTIGEGGEWWELEKSENYSLYCIQGNCIDRADTAGCNGKGQAHICKYKLHRNA